MARILALSFVFATLAPPAFGTGPMDPATVTCKAYETSGHQDMVQLDAAFHQALKGDPELAHSRKRTWQYHRQGLRRTSRRHGGRRPEGEKLALGEPLLGWQSATLQASPRAPATRQRRPSAEANCYCR